MPTFTITASTDPIPNYFSGPAILIMQQSYGTGSNATAARCAIHGVGLIGDGSGAYDLVVAQGKSDLIDGHSYLSGGCYDLNTQSPGANVEVYDSSLNTSYSDNYAPQDHNTGGLLPGVLSPTAAQLLAASLNPQTPKNYLSGLVLSNNATTATAVHIAPGEATDSTGSAIIRNNGCTVDLTATGLGGKDVIGPLAASTTYYFFVVSAANGATPPPSGTNPLNCIASTSLTPSFALVSNYSISQSGKGVNGSNLIYNVAGNDANSLPKNPLAGMAVGDVITGTGIPSNTKIMSLQAFFAAYSGSQIVGIQNLGASYAEIDFASGTSLADIAPNMLVDGTQVYSGTTVTNVCQTMTCLASGTTCSAVPCIVVSHNITGMAAPSCGTTTCIAEFGGNFTVTLSNPLSGLSGSPPSPITFTVQHGLYRLAGALYTDASGNVVTFHQDGDTFYLSTPVRDVPTPSACLTISSTASTCRLSVPCGRTAATCGTTQTVAVEAFGRLAALGTSTQILITSLDQSDLSPTPMTSVPGNTSTNNQTTDAYPFRVYTSADPAKTSGAVRLRASTGSTTVNEVTDGWVFHRAQ